MIERELQAQLNVQYLRGLKLASLRWVAVASLPIWLDAHWQILPSMVLWLVVVAEGFCLAMAAGYGTLEHRWSRRAAEVEPDGATVFIHTVWTAWDEVRTALWYGLALVSLAPWTCAVFDRSLAGSSLSSLSATAWTMLLLLAAAETLAHPRQLGGAAVGPLESAP